MMRLAPIREIDPAQWDAYIAGHPDGCFWATSAWLRYQRLCGTHADFSVGVVDGSALVGAVPIMAHAGVAMFDGAPAPLYDDAVVQSRIAPALLEHIVGYGITRWTVRDRPVRECETTDAYARISTTRVIDLARSLGDLWREVRHSYRALIHRAERRHTIRVYSRDMSDATMRRCGALHQHVTGRQTRPMRTWELMGAWGRAGHAILATAEAPPFDDEPLAYAYTIVYGGWAYYGSSAARVDDVGHGLLWASIRAARECGARFYEVGYLLGEDAKARQIQHFKEGFGGQDWAVRVHDVCVNVASC